MHKLRIHLLMFLLCGVQCLLHGMEDELKKSLLNIDDHNIVRDVIIASCLVNQDYHTYRAVAMLSRAHNKLVEDKYRSKKKCIEEYIQENKDVLPQLTGARSWNKDFSKCAWVTHDGDAAAPKRLGLTCIGKSDNQVIQQSASWEGFYFPIFEDDVRPFFDKDGRSSFYGYQHTRGIHGTVYYVAQYVLDVTSFFYQCHYRMQYNDADLYWPYPLVSLLQHPILIKAVLQSQEVLCTDKSKIFDIKGVTIPENYKLFKNNFGLEQVKKCYGRRTSYDCLEVELRESIDDQYEKQQAEKNNHNLQEK